MSRQTAHLENWYSHLGMLWGHVSRHPNPQLPDGTHVHTSQVESIDEEAGTAITKNTDYTLGEKRTDFGRGAESDINHSIEN